MRTELLEKRVVAAGEQRLAEQLEVDEEQKLVITRFSEAIGENDHVVSPVPTRTKH